MTFLICRISPRTSTAIFCVKSPPAMAVATFDISRSCTVRLDAMRLTLSVRSFHVPATPFTSACPPSLPSVPTSRATRVTSDANEESWSTIVLMVFFSSRISPLTLTVIFFERSPLATAVVTAALLPTCEVKLGAIEFTVSPRAFHGPVTPSTFACYARYFRCERAQLADHGVYRFSRMQKFTLERPAFDLRCHGLRQISFRDGANHSSCLTRWLNQVAD